MGMNSSKALNMVESSVGASVALVLKNSASCNTTIYGSNIINISNAHNVDLSNIKNKIFIKVDSTCALSQVSDSKVTQKITENLQQQAESITSGLGMNAADSTNFIHLMAKLSVAVQSAIEASVKTLTTGSNLINITDASGIKMNVVEQEVYIDTITKNVISQSMQSEVGQEAKVAIEQAAKAKSEGFNLSMGLIVFIVAAIVGSIFIVSWKNTITTVLMNPMTWLLVTTPILIGSSSLFVAGMFKKKYFWPYLQEVSTDNASETVAKRSKNMTIFLTSGISTVLLLLLDSALFYATIKSYASGRSQAPRATSQTSQGAPKSLLSAFSGR